MIDNFQDPRRVFEPFIEARHGQHSPSFDQLILTPEPGKQEALAVNLPRERRNEVFSALERLYGVNCFHRIIRLPGNRLAAIIHDSSEVRTGNEYWRSYYRHESDGITPGIHCRPCRPT
jgi:hypothetical protein